MNATYYWDFPVEEVKKKTSEESLICFFEQKKGEAQAIIKRIDASTLMPSVAKLNAIDEQLSLLFFYLGEGAEFELKSFEILSLIRQDYKKTFYEELTEKPEVITAHSLLYLLDDSSSKEPIWELNFLGVLMDTFDAPMPCVFNDWQYTLSYYDHLKCAARELIEELTPETFNQLYAKLLMINYKCSLLLDAVSLRKEFELSEVEYLFMVENESCDCYQHSFALDSEAFDMKFSIRRQIA